MTLPLYCIPCTVTEDMGRYKALLVPGYEAGSPAPGKPDIYNRRVVTRQEVQEALNRQQPLQKVESSHPGWQALKEKGGSIPVLVLHCTGYDYISRVSTSLSQVRAGRTSNFLRTCPISFCSGGQTVPVCVRIWCCVSLLHAVHLGGRRYACLSLHRYDPASNPQVWTGQLFVLWTLCHQNPHVHVPDNAVIMGSHIKVATDPLCAGSCVPLLDCRVCLPTCPPAQRPVWVPSG
jgi:hypothetical protein